MFKPNFNITHSILSNISEIASIKAVIERSRVLPLNEAQLRRQAIARMVHTSTSIEGNKLVQFQVDKVLSGMSVAGDDKSILEVKNYQLALQEVEKSIDTSHELTIDFVLKLHSLLMKGLLDDKKAGHFRSGPIYIIDELGDGREKLRFEGPISNKVPFLLNELLKWLSKVEKEKLHPIIIAGLFHSQFVHIHPFSDGNGRITRLLTTYLFYKYEWDFRKVIVLEDYYNRDRQAYYSGLSAGWKTKYIEGANFTPWLEYFTYGFLIEAKKAFENLQSIGFDKIHSLDSQVFLNKDEIKLMDFLTTTGKITSNDVVDILNIAKRTAQLKIKGLVDKKLLTSQGKGPSTYYLLAR